MKKLLLQLVRQLPYRQLERTSERGIYSKTPLFCTVSGGQDSIVTFFILLHTMSFPTNSFLGKDKKYEIFQIVHCQHFWQKKNILTSRFLFQLSSVFNLPYTLFLPEKQFFTENSTRTWRKRLFFRLVDFNQSLFLITGHNQSDTLETKLNHLFRGTSLKRLDSNGTQKNLTGYFFSSRVFSFTSKSYEFGSHQSLQKMKKRGVSLVFPKTDALGHSKFMVTLTGANFDPNMFLSSKTRFSYWDDRTNSSFTRKKGVNKKRQEFFFKKFLSQQTRHSFSVEEPGTGKKFIFQARSAFQKKLKNSSCFVFYSSSLFLVPRLWKPLQSQHRFAISRIINIYNLPVTTDRTNFSLKFSRNQVRQQLLPTLTLLLNKEISSSFFHFFEILTKDAQVIEKQASLLYFLLSLIEPENLQNPENRRFQILAPQRVSGQRVFQKEKDHINISTNVIKQTCQLSIQNLILQKLYRDSQERDLSFLHISTIQKDFLT